MGYSKRGQKFVVNEPKKKAQTRRSRKPKHGYEELSYVALEMALNQPRTAGQKRRAKILKGLAFDDEEIARQLAVEKEAPAAPEGPAAGPSRTAAQGNTSHLGDIHEEVPMEYTYDGDNGGGFNLGDGTRYYPAPGETVVQITGRTRRAKQMDKWNAIMPSLVAAMQHWEKETDEGRQRGNPPKSVWCPCPEGQFSKRQEEIWLVTIHGPSYATVLPRNPLTSSCRWNATCLRHLFMYIHRCWAGTAWVLPKCT